LKNRPFFERKGVIFNSWYNKFISNATSLQYHKHKYVSIKKKGLSPQKQIFMPEKKFPSFPLTDIHVEKSTPLRTKNINICQFCKPLLPSVINICCCCSWCFLINLRRIFR